MTTRYILADTETGGLTVEDGVVEVGWVELDQDANIIDQRESLIDPGTGFICPSASGVHDITIDMVQDKPTLDEFFSLPDAGCYGEPLIADRLLIAGHRVGFDHKFLAPYLQAPAVDQICTLRWARHLWPESPDHKLSTLKYALGLRKDAGDAHRVMSDIMVTYDLLRLILSTLNVSLDELAELSKQPLLLHRVPFGKYRGEHPKGVPHTYWRWALNNIEDMDQDLKHTAEHYLAKR